MGRKKKETEPLDYPVKVRTAFGRKLVEVAQELGRFPGDIVEEKLAAWIGGEYLLVLKRKLERAEQEEQLAKAGRAGKTDRRS